MRAKNVLSVAIVTGLVLLVLPVIVVTLAGRLAQLVSLRSPEPEPAIDFDNYQEEIQPPVGSEIVTE